MGSAGVAWLALVLALISVAVGCGDSGPPHLTCSTPEEGHQIVELDPAFRVCLPPNWRRLLPGDPGWQTVYGGHSDVEDNVANGSIRVFAVPLEPREHDTFLNLSIYLQSVPPGLTVESVAASYERLVTRVEPKVVDVVVDSVALRAGPAVRVAATRPKEFGRADRFSAYVILVDDEALYLIYTCDVDTVEQYEDMFLQSANSLEFE